MRYEKECKQVGELALKQLNLEKNKIKENFEDLPLSKILDLLEEEIRELNTELGLNEFIPIVKLDKTRILEELGDCISCLVGLLAAIQNRKDLV